MKRYYLFITLYVILGIGQSFAQKSSVNGEVFTPKGDLKALVIFAGFKGFDADQDLENWQANQEFPNYVVDGKCEELFFSDTLAFEQLPSKDNRSISRLFYEMSSPNRPFRLMADVYPRRININPNDATSWSKMNLNVIKELQKTDPNFDWSPYDQRTNRPNYLFDNSLSGPDGKPDYIIICYRYDKSWEIQPNTSMPFWQGSGGGISVLEGVYNFKFNENITIGTDGFHMNTVGVKSTENFRRLFQHELGHELLSCPHHFGTGGSIGSYFRTATMGWGTAVNSASCTRLVNAWERWLMGWIEIKHDLKSFEDNGTYMIDDYATTGEAIRIKIPNTKSQYLWIENHQLISVFDQSRWEGLLENIPEGSKGMKNIDKGLYFFVEDLMDDRSKIRTYLVSDMQAVNGTKFLNANGNWDYTTDGISSKSWKEYWNNILYTFERTEENLYDGINPFLLYRFDANQDGKIDNIHNYNQGRATESFPIVKEKVGDSTFMFYGNHACSNEDALRYRRTHSFTVNDTLSMVHNPPITNNPRYIERLQTLEPIYINGLKITVLALSKGTYTLEIKFDNNQADKDLRLCGNVTLKDIPNASIDMEVAPNITLKINKSGTINTLNSNGSTFINETRFVVDSAKIQLQKNSQLQIQDSSVVLFGSNAVLMADISKIYIEDKGSLFFASGSKLSLDEQSIIRCSKLGIIHFQKGAWINDMVLTKDFILPQDEECTGKQLLKKISHQ